MKRPNNTSSSAHHCNELKKYYLIIIIIIYLTLFKYIYVFPNTKSSIIVNFVSLDLIYF